MKPLRLSTARRQRWRRAFIIASFLLFPVTLNYFSPVLIVQGAINGAVTASAVCFGLLFLSGLVFGRGFCGWACPGAGLQEPLMAVNPAPVTGRAADLVKWAVWIPWLSIILTGYALAGAALTFKPLFMMQSWVSVDRPVMFIPYFTVLALVVWPALALGRRGFCHCLCWMAPFLILGDKAGRVLGLPGLRLGVRRHSCTSCGTCSRACPMSLPVAEMAARGDMRHAECVLCGECADTCPEKTLALDFGAKNAKSPGGRDVSGPESGS